MSLLHTPTIRHVSLTHVRDIDVVVRAIGLAKLVVLANISCRGVREVIVHCGHMSVKSEINDGSRLFTTYRA